MKANYENWMPKNLIKWIKIAALVSVLIAAVFGIIMAVKGVVNTIFFIIFIVFGVSAGILLAVAGKFSYMRKQFDYSNPNSISWEIIKYTADRIRLDADGSSILDVGCGSGALSISVAKNNPKSQVIGLDRWGIDYKDEFSKELCENNAVAEEVSNVKFIVGDAKKLDFDDETFDAICSNYVYHNIPGDRNKLLKESLRVLKKGGVFSIHDIFSPSKYPRIDKFIDQLKREGYEFVELIDTTDGTVLTNEEAKKTMLVGSKLLYGRK